MWDTFAGFVYRNSRPVLITTISAILIAGVFGLSVAKRMSPYGATDPATQSVQTSHRYEAATGRQIDPAVLALVTAGDVHSAAAQRRVRQVENVLRAGRDVAAMSSYYDTHDPD